MPTFGDLSTPIEEVKAFYLFWDDFKTWRDFCQHDEHNPEDSHDRYEKRWMEKENAKLRKEYDKEERKRIFKLTELAYENDPRIKKMREDDLKAKDAHSKNKKDNKKRAAIEAEEARQKLVEARQKAIDDAIAAEK